MLFAHGKIHEVEHENVGVEGGHKGEELVEHQTAKVIRSGIRHHKMKPYKAVEKAERQLMSANAEYFYQKSLRDNPQIAQVASNPISRMWQKRRIKQQYAKAARQAGQAAAQGAAATAENGFRVTKLAAEGGERVAEFAARNWKTILIVAVFGLLALLLITGLQSCTVMAGTAGTGVTASTSCAMKIPPAITVLSPTTACRPLAGPWTRPTIRKYTPRRWLRVPHWRTSTVHSMWTIRQISKDTRCPFRMW